MIAPRLRQDNETIKSSLEELATLFNPVGVGQRATRARLPHALAALKLMRRELLEFPMELDEQVQPLIQMIVTTADKTLACAEATLTQARTSADNLLDLLVAWRTDPAAVSRQLARTDWLMDGWDRICRLWSHSDKAADRRRCAGRDHRHAAHHPSGSRGMGWLPCGGGSPATDSPPGERA